MITNTNSTISDYDSRPLSLSPTLRFAVAGFLSLLLAVGVVGNGLTLLVVRRKYGTQFSVLHSSTTSLLLHLSFCDLLYICVGFPHFIHVLVLSKDREMTYDY